MKYLLIGTLAFTMSTTLAAQAPSPDETAVRVALEHYLAGHATGLGDHFRQGMHQGGTMYWVRGGLATRSFPEYAAGASGKPAADEDKRRRRIAMVDITNDAAIAKIVLEYPGATLTDYMTLLKVDGKWQIVAKAFTRQPVP